ncbi:hypothetical protein [Thermosyntropha sp.]|uniref:hypothetical protein n=1 Tax=Thermosyntropha sp. TaxID=2740820 RepID=UPI0025F92EEF|nr:hypothetical protein [Thermosyntropha sp.]MBO8158189.1 hypothetical protein [Thermosyntropha sp.]
MIEKEMLVVDVIDKYPETEKVFRSYEEKVGSCIMCSHLFNTLEAVSKDYNFDLEELIRKLEKAALKEEEE